MNTDKPFMLIVINRRVVRISLLVLFYLASAYATQHYGYKKGLSDMYRYIQYYQQQQQEAHTEDLQGSTK